MGESYLGEGKRASSNVAFNVGLAGCSVTGSSFLWKFRDKSLISLEITAVSPLTYD